MPGRPTGGESRHRSWALGGESLASGPVRVKQTPVFDRPLFPASRGGIILGHMDIVIRCRDLRKVYEGKPPVEALRGLDLEVGAGECFGILGPNGAGKTTTVEILEGILAASSGDVEVLGLRWGRSDRTLRERIGVSLQETRLADKLTVSTAEELLACSGVLSWRSRRLRNTGSVPRFAPRPAVVSLRYNSHPRDWQVTFAL